MLASHKTPMFPKNAVFNLFWSPRFLYLTYFREVFAVHKTLEQRQLLQELAQTPIPSDDQIWQKLWPSLGFCASLSLQHGGIVFLDYLRRNMKRICASFCILSKILNFSLSKSSSPEILKTLSSSKIKQDMRIRLVGLGTFKEKFEVWLATLI